MNHIAKDQMTAWLKKYQISNDSSDRCMKIKNKRSNGSESNDRRLDERK